MKIYLNHVLCMALSLCLFSSSYAESSDSSWSVSAWQSQTCSVFGEGSSLEILTPCEVYGTNNFEVEACFIPAAGLSVKGLTAHCAVGEQVQEHTFSEDTLIPGQPFKFTFDKPLTAAYGETVTYRLWLSVGDEESERVEQSTTPLKFKTHRRTVLEKGTGMWCPYCPTGIVAMDSLELLYPDDFIGIAVHSRDALENYAYVDAMQFPAYPSGFFNRKYMERPPMGSVHDGKQEHYIIGNGGWGSVFLSCQAERADADIDLKVEYKAPYVKLHTETRFAVETQGETYQIAFVLVEDQVSEPGNYQYYQKNNYAGASFTVGGYEKLPFVIRDPVFRNVAREIYDDPNGIPNSVPTDIVPGQVYSFDTQLKLPKHLKQPKNAKVVALLLRRSTGEVVNARQVRLIPDESTGIDFLPEGGFTELKCSRIGNSLCISYTPSSALTEVQFRLYSVQGSLIHRLVSVSESTEPQTIQIPCPETPGVYILTATQDYQTQALRLSVR